jgi:MoaA/NifB/PqqE/SkfB family radical SAM enzyme
VAPPHEDPELHRFLVSAPPDQAQWLAAHGLPPATLLALTNACAQRCFFCAGPGTTAVSPGDVTGEEHIRAQIAARPPGVERLLIGGNEPTLHPNFEAAMQWAEEAGYSRIDLMTNGATLGRNAERWRAAGIAEVVVPLYGSDAATHDAVAGAACFHGVVTGLDAAFAAGISVRVHTLLLRRTLPRLPGLARWVRERWGRRLFAGLLRDKSRFDWSAEAPSLDEIRRVLTGIAAGERPGLILGPRCVVADHADEMEEPPLLARLYFATQAREYPEDCTGCGDRERCAGVVAAYARRDAGWLRPRVG